MKGGMKGGMNEAMLTCKDEQRRHQMRRQKLNGLDFLEVDDSQTVLCVHFLGEVPETITADHIRIEGGQRIRDIQVLREPPPQIDRPEDPTQDSCLRIYLNKPGDFSTYILRLVERDAEGNWVPLTGFDPRYSYLSFTFKAGCPTDLDCKMPPVCPPEERIEPEINYLAKDYASFRQLIFDRLSLTMPAWTERHVPDIGVALVELLAYMGDQLSYYQDAVATEAYLQTARQRISVRRHVRLIDYLMHEGCNARTWVWMDVDTDTDPPLAPNDIFFITTYPKAPPAGTPLNELEDLRNIPASHYEVFEPVTQQPISLYAAHSTIQFYTWGDRQCCLPQGTTTATLLDSWIPPDPPDGDGEFPLPPDLKRRLQLKVGDILIVEEVKGAETGNPADADLNHRHAVRLIRVQPGVDALYPQQIENVATEVPTPIVDIEWAVEDALLFPLCISGLGPAPECELLDNISVAHGNVILVDHGRTMREALDPVREKEALAHCTAEGQPADIIPVPERFRPHLEQIPLTFRQPISAVLLTQAAASVLLHQEPRGALPQLYLTDTHLTVAPDDLDATAPTGPAWIPTLDLLDSHAPAADLFWEGASVNPMHRFVVEMNNDGMAHLRFGMGEIGHLPAVGTTFSATYRIGNGMAGNIGADTIAHLVFRRAPQSGVKLEPHNPLPAQGGTLPEPLSEVKQFAPGMVRSDRQRAVTAQDYADLVMRDFKAQVQRAAAVLRWMGSWYEVLVAIDPIGPQTADPLLLEAIATQLHRYRRIGYDLVVQQAVYVPLAIALTVCVLPNYLRGHVKAALLEVFSNRRLPDGRKGFFHPDNLTFGTGIYLSQLVAAAQRVTGVMSVQVTQLERFAEGPNQELETGILPLSPLEIARLDNDPNFPENGQFTLDVRGGRG